MVKKSTTLAAHPNWFLLGALALVGAFIFFAPFLAVIFIAALMAYLLFPVFNAFSHRMNPRIAATLTMIISILLVIVPFAFLLILALTQGVALASSLTSMSADSIANSTHPVTDSINAALLPIAGQPVVTVEDVQQFFKEVIPGLIHWVTAVLVNVAGNIPVLLSSAIIYGFLFNTFLLYRTSLFSIIRTLSPFEDTANSLYIERSGSIVRASFVGQFLISFVTAVSSALLLFIIGLQSYFLFFVIIFTILGMVPLGAGIVMIPLAFIAMLTGQFWGGLWVLLIFVLVICNIDSFMRPRLMPKNARLLPALTTLSTFCGIYYFGLLGVIYGPLIAIILLTTLEVYTYQKTGQHLPAQKKVAPKSRRIARSA